VDVHLRCTYGNTSEIKKEVIGWLPGLREASYDRTTSSLPRMDEPIVANSCDCSCLSDA